MLDRLEFLALAVALALAPARAARGAVERRQEAFTAEVAILYGALRFQVAGMVDEMVDPATRRYAVRARGQGSGTPTPWRGRGSCSTTGGRHSGPTPSSSSMGGNRA